MILIESKVETGIGKCIIFDSITKESKPEVNEVGEAVFITLWDVIWDEVAFSAEPWKMGIGFFLFPFPLAFSLLVLIGLLLPVGVVFGPASLFCAFGFFAIDLFEDFSVVSRVFVSLAARGTEVCAAVEVIGFRWDDLVVRASEFEADVTIFEVTVLPVGDGPISVLVMVNCSWAIASMVVKIDFSLVKISTLGIFIIFPSMTLSFVSL